jgi:hypothetical protein
MFFKEGDKSEVVCRTCNHRTTTTMKPDKLELEVAGRKVLIEDLLLGICDKCGKPASVPAQSTDKVKAAIDRAMAG